MAVQSIEPGQRLGDKYVAERLLGEGGMGFVVAARALDGGRRVAVKILRQGLLDGAEAVQRFAHETRSLTSLRGEHVVAILDAGALDDGTPFMVMEYLDGANLAGVVQARGAPSIEQAVDWVMQAMAGLAGAHARGLVHRDLTLGNLFLAKRPDGSEVVKVLDFGLAKSMSGGPVLTKEGFYLGSPSTMSPEQLQSSRGLDARSDVWALGAVLHELIGGRPPFEARGLEEQLRAILAGRRAPLRELRPDLPPELEAAIDACLVPELERRMPSLAELARRLAPYGPPSARELERRIVATLGGNAAPEPDRSSSSNAWWVELGLVLVAAGLALAIWLGR
jgi:eukaryotic-like serine/threonine-protein kinase